MRKLIENIAFEPILCRDLKRNLGASAALCAGRRSRLADAGNLSTATISTRLLVPHPYKHRSHETLKYHIGSKCSTELRLEPLEVAIPSACHLDRVGCLGSSRRALKNTLSAFTVVAC